MAPTSIIASASCSVFDMGQDSLVLLVWATTYFWNVEKLLWAAQRRD